MKKALIFGVSGQDGAYLSLFLLSKNYNVTGEDGRNALELAEKVSNSIKNIEV